MNQVAVKKSPVFSGVLYAAPVVTAYFPLAFAYGLSAREAGLSFLQTVLMSLLVYAGASQMIAVGLLVAGESAWMIVLTTAIVNLRHSLLAAAIAPFLKQWKLRERLAFGGLLTDETFTLLSIYFRKHEAVPEFALAVNAAAHLSWATGSALGYLLSGFIFDLKKLGLDYALISMLLALLAIQLRGLRMVWVVIFSGALSLLGMHFGLGSQAILVATLLGPLLGLLFELRELRCRT